FMNGNMALSECLMEMERVYIAQQRMLISKNSLTKLCLYERTIAWQLTCFSIYGRFFRGIKIN
ncbi:MAG: hypothetical protein ACI845_004134, partial [Gammaproteobacteria bacterium]